MLTIKNITRNFGAVQAVKETSFEIEKGEIFGLLGPDGAGKTTLLRMISTLLVPDSGNITINNLDVVKDYAALRMIIGYMPGKFSLYTDLTIAENLKFFATIFGTTIEANYDLIKEIYSQIEPFKDRRAGKLSGGMKQKLALCCALIHKPELLILDEPSTGVDPVSRKEFWDILGKLKSAGITIVVSTPYMDEAMRCDRIAMMIHGEIIEIDTPKKIVEKYDEVLYAVKSANMFQLLNDIRSYNDTASCFTFGEYLHVTLKPNCDYHALKSWLEAKQYPDFEFKVTNPNIEDYFMSKMIKMEHYD
jgi:ABC-type multidrug transport system ATPase subunit